MMEPTQAIRAVPVGQLRQAIWNPRTINQEQLESLKASIRSDPAFMWRRPILAMADGEVYAGNQRLAACMALEWETVPAVLEDVDSSLRAARSIRDNNTWGQWDDAVLGTLVQQAQQDGVQVQTLGFDDRQMSALLKTIQAPVQPTIRDSSQESLLEERNATHRGIRETSAGKKVFEENYIRQIVLYFHGDDYVRIVDKLADIRAFTGTDSNTDAVAMIVESYHAEHCARTTTD